MKLGTNPSDTPLHVLEQAVQGLWISKRGPAFVVLGLVGLGGMYLVDPEFFGVESYRDTAAFTLFGLASFWFVLSVLIFSFKLVQFERVRRALHDDLSLEQVRERLRGLNHLRERLFAGDHLRDDAAEIWSDDLFMEVPRFARVGLGLLPAVFTAIGILFTFIGLVSGLAEINPSQGSDEIMRGMETLLAGVKLAFRSSILGIFLSIIALMISRQTQTDVEFAASQLVAELAQRNRGSQLQLLVATSKSTASSDKRLEEITELSREQASKLGTIASDLPGAIAAALEPQLTNISGAVSGMGRDANQLHMQMLEVLMSTFLTQFNDQLGGQLEQLGAVLERTLQWHASTQELTTQLLTRLEQNVTAHQQLQVALRASVERQTETASAQSDHVARYESLGANLARHAGEMTDAQRSLEESLKVIPQTVKEFGGMSYGLRDQIQQGLDRNVQLLDSTGQRLNQLETLLRQSVGDTEKGLQRTLSTFDSTTAEVVDRFHGTLMGLSTRLDELERVAEALARANGAGR